MNKIRIDREALFSDGTCDYRSPVFCDAGDTVRVRLRAKKGNVLAAKCLLSRKAEEREDNREAEREEIAMRYVFCDALFDYFDCEVLVDDEPLRYVFFVTSTDGSDRCYYGRRGASDMEDDFFEIIAGHRVPEWAQGCVFYQIFPDSFFNGDLKNDVVPYEYRYIDGCYSNAPDTNGTCVFNGGDLQGVIDKLDYLKGLGVEGIYLNPVFVSPSNHKYDTQDYEHIDPHLGKIVRDGGRTLEPGETDNALAERYRLRVMAPENLAASDALFAKLVAEAHARDIRVIIDGVFNHCGSFHKWMDREGIYGGEPIGREVYKTGAFKHPESPYRKYFRFYSETPDIEAGEDDAYEGWWDYVTLPKLNYEESESLCEDVLNIARKWLEPPYNADGWRLDVAADLGHSYEFNVSFWRRFRDAVKRVSEDKLIIAEHYGETSDRLRGDQWDGIMNYSGFMEPVSMFLTGVDKHSDNADMSAVGDTDRFFADILKEFYELPAGSEAVMMNQLSNHDHSRFLTRTNGLVGRVENLGEQAASEGIRPNIYRQGAVMQMTWPGMPALYYGDEAGMTGFTDPDSRRPYPWGSEDREFIEFHRYLIYIHKQSAALKRGSFRVLASVEGLAAYARFTAEDIVCVAVNCFKEREVSLPVWIAGASDGSVFERVMYTDGSGYNVGSVTETVKDGGITFMMGEGSSVIWRVRADK